MKRVRRLTISIVFVAAAIFLGAATMFVLRRWVELEALGSPEEVELYRRWQSKPLKWPSSALKSEPFPDELLTAAKDFFEAYEAQDVVDLVLVSRALTSADWNATVKEAELESLRPILASFEAVARHPDYRMSVFAEIGTAPGVYPFDGIPDFPLLDRMTKLLDSDSRTHTKAGRNAEALRLAESILLASRTDALDSFLMHGISLMYRARGISTWMHAVEGCAEIDLLKKAIARMQELEAIFDNVPADSHPSDLNNVSSLRAVARHGIQVEFQGLTGRELADAALLAQARYLEERVLPDIQVDSPLRAEVLENFERMKTGWPQTTWASFGGRPTLAEITARAVSPDVFDYSLELNSRQEFFSRQQKVKIHFDLLRLETAAKLFHLERGREPDLLSELIPNYLPELPVDPWAPDGAPYRRAAEGDYYSLGPDGVDDGGGKTPFSSRSGTMSGVDVYIPPQ